MTTTMMMMMMMMMMMKRRKRMVKKKKTKGRMTKCGKKELREKISCKSRRE
jgi:hypothetical protein